MAKPFREWTVLPHGKLSHVDENILSVTGLLQMPPMGVLGRRMTVVRLSDGRLVVYSAIALHETEMNALESFGQPAFLIVPNDIHRMDVKPWKDRYPAMTVVAPPAARAKVEEVVHVDDSWVDFADPSVRFNLANREGLRGWLFKTIGMTGDEPHIPPPVRMRQVKDRAALRAQLESWSRLPSLKRVIISHGNIIAEDAGRVLGRIAHDLAA